MLELSCNICIKGKLCNQFQAKQLGGFTCTKSGTPTVAELGACFDTLVGYTTPSC